MNTPCSWVEGMIIRSKWHDTMSFGHQLCSLLESFKSHFKVDAIKSIFEYFILDHDKWSYTLHGLGNALLEKMCITFTHPDWTFEEIQIVMK